MGPGYPFPRPEGATAYDVIPRKIPYQGQDGDHNPEVPQQTCVDTHSKVAPVADRRYPLAGSPVTNSATQYCWVKYGVS